MGFDNNCPHTGDLVIHPSDMGKKEVRPAIEVGRLVDGRWSAHHNGASDLRVLVLV
jgi:hypothetical protein